LVQERARIINVPEYLAPGVYVDEVPSESKVIPGVPTGAMAFAAGVLLGLVAALALERARRRRHLSPIP
jgi:apolipoprotein N-acyltransferase